MTTTTPPTARQLRATQFALAEARLHLDRAADLDTSESATLRSLAADVRALALRVDQMAAVTR